MQHVSRAPLLFGTPTSQCAVLKRVDRRSHMSIEQHVNFPAETPETRSVVGVVGSFKTDGLNAPPHEQAFIPYRQLVVDAPIIVPFFTVICRTALPPLSLADTVKQKLDNVDPAHRIRLFRSLLETQRRIFRGLRYRGHLIAISSQTPAW